jgi:nucleoside phosphorylase/tetratricopeptide (TPR) repeat protein/uncharacterized protein with HEPN domain
MQQPNERRKTDLGIITIKEEEFEAVLQRFKPQEFFERERRTYAYCQVAAGDRQLGVAIIRCLESGQVAAQQAAQDLLEELDPSWLLLVGIAGGVPAEEYSLGDVMLAGRLHDFSVTAAVEGRESEQSPRGGPVHRAVARLLEMLPGHRAELERSGWNRATALKCKKPRIAVAEDLEDKSYYGDSAWKAKVRNSLNVNFPSGKAPRRPKFRIGAVASSNALVKDTKLLTQWQKAARDVTHVEMELGGVYQAAWRTKITPVLAIRGLSDIVGYRRSADWTDFACQAAASFAYYLVSSGLISTVQRESRQHGPGPPQQVWNVSRRQNRYFQGRTDLLDALHRAFHTGPPAEPVIQALYGLGGVGKSQIAVEYAYRYRDEVDEEYEIVWWIEAEDSSTLMSDYNALAEPLGIPLTNLEGGPLPPERVRDSVRKRLEEPTRSLLVFDNAPGPKQVVPFLPNRGRVHIVITSVNPDWRPLGDPLEVPPLDLTNASQFLLNRTGQTDRQSAKQLADDLEGLPLALEQAGGYITSTGKTLAAYVGLFRASHRELLRHYGPLDYRATVATTWHLSFQEVQTTSPVGADLLRLFAYMDAVDIPLQILGEAAKQLPKSLADVADEISLDEGVKALRRFSLIHVEDGVISVHRLVQMVTRDALDSDAQRIWATAAGDVLNKIGINLSIQGDLAGAQTRHERALRNFEAAGDDAQLLAPVIYTRLLLARVVSHVKLVPPVVLRLLARMGERERALDYAEHRERPGEKFQAICHVAEGAALRGERAEAEQLLQRMKSDAKRMGGWYLRGAIIDVARASNRAGCVPLGAAIADILMRRLEDRPDQPEWMDLYERELPLAIADVWLGRGDVSRLVANATRWHANAAAEIVSTLALAGQEQAASELANEVGPIALAALATAQQILGKTEQARRTVQVAYSRVLQHSQDEALVPIARALARQGDFESELRKLSDLAADAAAFEQPGSQAREPRRFALARAAEVHALAGDSEGAWKYIETHGKGHEHYPLFADFVLAGLIDDAQRALLLPVTLDPAQAVGEGAETLWDRREEERARRWIPVAIRLSPLRASSGALDSAIARLARALLARGSLDSALNHAKPLEPGRLHDTLLLEIADRHAAEGQYEDVCAELDKVSDVTERAEGYARCAAAAVKNQSLEDARHFERRAEKIIATLPDSSRNDVRNRLALHLAKAGDKQAIERLTSGLEDHENVWKAYVDGLVAQGLLDEARRVVEESGITSPKLEQAELRENAKAWNVARLKRRLRQMHRTGIEAERARFLEALEALDGIVPDAVAVVEALIEGDRLSDAYALLSDIPEYNRDAVLTALARAEAGKGNMVKADQLISGIREPRVKAGARAAVFAKTIPMEQREADSHAALRRLETFLQDMKSEFTDRDLSPALRELALSLAGQPNLAISALRSALAASTSLGEHEFLQALKDLVPVLETLPDGSIVELIFVRLLDISR